MTLYTLSYDYREPLTGLSLAEAGRHILDNNADRRNATYDLREDSNSWWHLTETRPGRGTIDTVIFVKADFEDNAWELAYEAVAMHDAFDSDGHTLEVEPVLA